MDLLLVVHRSLFGYRPKYEGGTTLANKPPYALSSEAVLKQEQTSLTGLTKEAAQTRLNENGPNELAQAEKKGMLARF